MCIRDKAIDLAGTSSIICFILIDTFHLVMSVHEQAKGLFPSEQIMEQYSIKTKERRHNEGKVETLKSSLPRNLCGLSE